MNVYECRMQRLCSWFVSVACRLHRRLQLMKHKGSTSALHASVSKSDDCSAAEVRASNSCLCAVVAS